MIFQILELANVGLRSSMVDGWSTTSKNSLNIKIFLQTFDLFLISLILNYSETDKQFCFDALFLLYRMICGTVTHKSLRVVQTGVIFFKSMSERDGSDIQRLWNWWFKLTLKLADEIPLYFVQSDKQLKCIFQFELNNTEN